MPAPDPVPSRPHTVLRWGEGQFAFDVAAVQEVVANLALTPLPRADSGWLGVGNLRGEILPVVSLQKWFAGTSSGASLPDAVLVVLRTPMGRLALAAESVAGVRAVPLAPESAAGEILAAGEPEFVTQRWQPPGEEAPLRCLDAARLAQKLREYFVLSTLPSV